jgi:hypothetical protein
MKSRQDGHDVISNPDICFLKAVDVEFLESVPVVSVYVCNLYEYRYAVSQIAKNTKCDI